MAWKVQIERKAEKELNKLNSHQRNLIVNHLREKLLGCTNPRIYGKPLRGDLSGYWRYRVEDFRIICVIEDTTQIVKVLKVAHRKHVYVM